MKRINFDVFDLIERHKSGVSIKELSKETGIGRKTITRRFESVGFVQRNRSESMFVRMANTAPEERARLAAAAHEAVKGRKHTINEQIQRAKTREIRRIGISRTEQILSQMLNDLGFLVTPQKAIHTYNVDIAINGSPVVVEVFGGGWHASGKHLIRHRQRFDYLINNGYYPIVVWVDGTKFPLESGAANYIVANIEEIRRAKPVWSKEKMIRGNGDPVSIFRLDNDDIAGVVPPNTRDDITGRFVSRAREKTIRV
jgi:very-short-patch-repair endonuclease